MSNQKGAIPLLLLIAAVGIVAILGVVSFAPFRNTLLSTIFPKQSSQAAGAEDWPMSGANPQRTSWTSAEAPGLLKVQWIKPLEPYVSQKVQVIAANKTLFISTSRGLYAFDSDTAAEKWVFPTELPLGNAPTFDNGTVYVGGLDRKLYALDANTGQKKWEFSAEGGFTTNPLVINNTVYLGNRDTYFYAIDASNGQLKWRYKTGGQVLQSAAYNNGVIYFGSQDASGYALNENPSNPNDPTTILKWKSAKLPGWGFHSWWPVVYQDKIIFVGSAEELGAPANSLVSWLYPTSYKVPIDTTSFPQGQLPGIKGVEPGNWPAGQATFDIRTNPAGNSLPDYYEQNPKKRRGYVLNQNNGIEVQYDMDADGLVDAAPFTVLGAKSGNIYPPVVGADGVLYFQMINYYNGAIPGAVPVGWKIGTPFLTLPVSKATTGGSPWFPFDEPTGLSIGGKYISWNLCCDRFVGSANLSIANPYPIPPSNVQGSTRQWRHLSGTGPPPMDTGISELSALNYYQQNIPYIWNPNAAGNILNHIEHADQVGPAIYDGKLFVIRSNALLALSPTGLNNSAPLLPLAKIQSVTASMQTLTTAQLKTKLEDQIQKMIAAGHLRSGYGRSGIVDQFTEQTVFFGEDKLMHYWHSPGENITILLRTLPHLSPALQTQLKTYIQNEQTLFPMQTITHIGFTSGAQRESFDFRENPGTLGSQNNAPQGPLGGRNLDNYYGLWKYAQTFGNAKQLFDSLKNYSFPAAPLDTDLPNKLNNRITGLTGYLELQKLAGYPQDSTKAAELAHLMNVRASQLKWDVVGNRSSVFENNYYSVLITAWNFLHMMPELAEHLNQNALIKAQSVVTKYESMAPYWMQAESEEAQLENVVMPYYQQYTLFQAKAKVLKQSQQELVKNLDTPIYPVGDLYYIDNLVAAIEAPLDPNATPPPSLNPSPVASASSVPSKPGDIDGNNKVDIFDYNILLTDFGKTGDFPADIDKSGKVDIFDYNLLLTNFGK